jgi:hypothetical protein
MSAAVFELLQYGARANFWLTIEGIDCVWSEAPISLNLPTSYSRSSATLSIDGSSEIGSRVRGGIGSGLPLSFLLLDSKTEPKTIGDFMRRAARFVRLTSDLSPGSTSAAVADSSAVTAGDEFYVGNERVRVGTVASATSLAGLSRGADASTAAGSRGYGSRHLAEGSGAHLTDYPREWAGREVRLYLLPQTTTGHQPGVDLTDHSVEVFRGYISERPERDAIGGFGFNCLSMERRLATALSPIVSGQIDTKTAIYTCQPSDKIQLGVRYEDAANNTIEHWLTAEPYKDLASPFVEQNTHAKIRADVVAAFDAAILAANAGGQTHPIADVYFANVGGVWDCVVNLSATIPSGQIIDIAAFGSTGQVQAQSIAVTYTTAMPSTFYQFTGNPFHVQDFDPKPQSTGYGSPFGGVGFVPESGDVDDVPDSGALSYAGRLYRYGSTLVTDSIVYLLQVESLPNESELVEWDGETAEILQADSGSVADVLRRLICSHVGDGARSATYDTLATGYGLHASMVDLDSFDEALGGAVGSFGVDVALSSQSLAGLFSGMFELSDRAIVCRDDGTGTQKITAIRTSPAGSGTLFDLTDADLLIGKEDPVAAQLLEVPNQIEVTLDNGLEGDEASLIYRQDRARVGQQGLESLSVTLPIRDISLANDLAAVWAGSVFSRDQSVGVYQLRIPPWGAGRAQVGDVIQIDLTHGGAWDYVAGAPGFSGAARVVGRELSLQDCAITLTVITAGVAGLSPAAEVVAFDVAAAPTYIEIGRKYFPHFSKAREKNGADIKILHFEPGTNETVAEGYTIRSVSDTGAACRLVVQALVGSPVLSGASFLTLPISSDALISEYQTGFAHSGDGGGWQ